MSHLHRTPGRLRCLLIWSGATAALGLLVVTAVPEIQGVSDRSFAGLLVGSCALASLPVAGWLWVLTTLVVLEAHAPRRRPTPGVPVALRRLVLLACGVAVIGVGGVAHADVGAHDHPAGTGRAGLAGLPLPDRATGPATLTWLARATSPREVVVRPGDSLWSIAVADLPAGSGDAEVAAHWRRIYRLNRGVIGPDPDLIRPHQHLLLPPSGS
jgi:hypothetical protein